MPLTQSVTGATHDHHVGAPGRRLSDLEIIALLWFHGFGPVLSDTPGPQGGVYENSIVTGGAIILAESSGRTHAVGHYTHNVAGRGPRMRCTVRGIWQISDCAHPDVSDACAFDPGCSTGAAHGISNGGQDWSAWSTFNNRAYVKYRHRMMLAWHRFQNMDPNHRRGFDPGRAVGENNPITNLAEVAGGLALAGTTELLRWFLTSGVLIRVALVLGGMVMIYLGVKGML